MPENINFNIFNSGWIPSDDEIAGRKNGFLQFNNVDLDKNGAVTLAGGTIIKHFGFSANLHTLYSSFIAGSRKDYSCSADGKIYRNITQIASGGDSLVGCFGNAFKYTLACSGDARVKDDGSSTFNLGITAPVTAPLVTVVAGNAPKTAFADVVSNIISPLTLGHHAVITDSAGTYVQLTANDRMFELTGAGDGTGVAALQTWDVTPPIPSIYNLNVLTGVGTDNVGAATDNDYINLTGYVTFPWGKSLQLDVLLEEGDSDGTMVANYYRFIIEDIAAEASFDANGPFSVRMRRNQFVRIGSSAADWSTVYGFRITFYGDAFEVVNIAGTNFGQTSLAMVGGSKTQQGTYEYMQVNVRNDGSYVGKSTMSPTSKPVTIDMMQAFITPLNPVLIDGQCNEAWIFRRGGLLEKWYLVKVFDSVTGFTGGYDTFSDVDAIQLNITYNANLISIAATGVDERIHAIVGPLQGRWYYFTDSFMYPSDINNPDLVDSTIAVRLTSSNNEIFFWAFQVGERSVLIGTSQDIYLLSGTFITQPDFSVDQYYSGFGCEYPPIVKDATEAANGVFYLAKDGWRLAGSDGETTSLVAPNLDVLYQGEDRYGYAAPNLEIMPGYTERFPIVVGKNKLWCFITGTGRCEVYDFTRKYWRVIDYVLGDVGCAYSTQDGQILAYYKKDGKMREIDSSETKLIDRANRQLVTLKTPVLDNDTPRQRKDSYNLILHVFTGLNGSLTASIIDDRGIETIVSNNIVSALKILDRHIDISMSYQPPNNLIKSYQLVLTGLFEDFQFDGAEITFDTHPLPLSFLRVQSQNFGTASYKRLSSLPFQIDTRGFTCQVTCLVDNVAHNPMTVLSNYKKSFNYTFLMQTSSEIVRGRDYEFTIAAGASQGLFEFYGFASPAQNDLEVLPEQKFSHIIPTSNFGSANKKRVRVWPFVINPLGGNVTFQPLVDCGLTTPTVFSGNCKHTFFHFYKTDVFGVDYGGALSSSTPFEFYEVLPPDIVQILPIARQFDQVGPLEMFKYGKAKQMELRVMAFNPNVPNSDLPFNIYFNDNTVYSGTFEIENAKEASYFVGVPKGTSGAIVRIELGPTSYDFHRFYIRLQTFQSGKDTEGEWITLTSLGQS